MTNEEFKNKLYEECPELKLIKPAYTQTQKMFNNFIWESHRDKILDLLEQEIDERMREAVQDVV